MTTNTSLTIDMVTMEALRLLHQELNFVPNTFDGYEDEFGKTPKIGSSLRIRKPVQYEVTSGEKLTVQNSVEEYVDLDTKYRRHVGLNFTSSELALDIDQFSQRYLRPAVTRLAADVEAVALSMLDEIYQFVDDDGGAFDLRTMALAQANLGKSLVPTADRCMIMDPSSAAEFMIATSGLFHAQQNIVEQYREGMIGRTMGFDIYQNTHIPFLTTGTAPKTTLYTVNGANQTGSDITIQTGSATFKVGDRVTFAGCNRVHPETKADLGELQVFVVTEDSGASATTLKISPAIVTSGARQNVSASPSNSGAVVKLGAGASEVVRQCVAFHKEAFATAFVDLPLPDGVDLASRQRKDGISIRIVRDYDINDDNMPCRLDVEWFQGVIRPELATIVHADGAST